MVQRVVSITHIALLVVMIALFGISLVGIQAFQAWTPRAQAVRSIAVINGSLHYGSFVSGGTGGLSWYVGPAEHMRDFPWSWRPTWRRSGFFGYVHVQVPLMWMVVPIGMSWVLARVLRRRVRAHYRAAGLCPQCRYDLRGSQSTCPECGLTIDGTHSLRCSPG